MISRPEIRSPGAFMTFRAVVSEVNRFRASPTRAKPEWDV
jgi:hypothetical protein